MKTTDKAAKRSRVCFSARRFLIFAFLLWSICMPVLYLNGTEICAPFSALFRFPLFLALAHTIPPLMISLAVCVGVFISLVFLSTRRFCQNLALWLYFVLALAVDIWGQILCYQAFFSPDKELISYQSYLYFSGAHPMDASLYLISLFADLALFLIVSYPLISRFRVQKPENEKEPEQTITTDAWSEIFQDEKTDAAQEERKP